MKILMITPMDPFSCSFGGEQRTHLLYKALLSIGDVYVIQSANLNEKMSDHFAKVFAKPQTGIKRIVDGLWYRIISKVCPNCWMMYVPFPLKADIDEIFPGINFDIVVCRSMHLVGLLHPWNIAPLVIDVDDDPIQSYDTIHKEDLCRIRRWLARKMLGNILNRILRHAKAFWLSNPEQEHCSSVRRKADILMNVPILPVEVSHVACNEVLRENYIFTIGFLGHPPNCLGINQFIDEVWPAVRRKYPSLVYKIAGKGLPPVYIEKWTGVAGVELLGFVDDIASLYRNALACVVPINSGSGTCIKVLESMAYSRVCISTDFGSRGIPKKDIAGGYTNILQYTDVDSFMQSLSLVIENVNTRKSLEKKGELYFHNHFSYEAFNRQVENVVTRVVASKR